MAASIVDAILVKLDSLTYAAPAPKWYFDQAPQTDASSNQQRLPYGILLDQGLQPEYQSDHGGLEVGSFTLQIFGTSLAQVDAIAAVVKWGGTTPGALGGLDFCDLTLTSPLYFMALMRTSERRTYAGFDYQNNRCYLIELAYTATTEIRAAG